MERQAPRVCFALLWGCVLGAATAQGKEGECVRGGRPGPGAAGFPDLGASRSPARLDALNFGDQPGAAQSRSTGVGRARGLRLGRI